MTLAAIIEAYEQHRALDFVPAAVSLTDRGNAVVALSRLREQLRRLDADDRTAAAHQLRDLLDELEPVPATA